MARGPGSTLGRGSRVVQVPFGSVAFAADPDPEPDTAGVQVTVEITPRADPPMCGHEPWPPGWPRRGHGAEPRASRQRPPAAPRVARAIGNGRTQARASRQRLTGPGPRSGKGIGANAGAGSADPLRGARGADRVRRGGARRCPHQESEVIRSVGTGDARLAAAQHLRRGEAGRRLAHDRLARAQRPPEHPRVDAGARAPGDRRDELHAQLDRPGSRHPSRDAHRRARRQPGAVGPEQHPARDRERGARRRVRDQRLLDLRRRGVADRHRRRRARHPGRRRAVRDRARARRRSTCCASRARACPTLVIKAEPDAEMHTAAVDQRAGAMAAVMHLIELGHRSIAHSPDPLDWFDARAREQGWRDALADAGLPIAPPVVGDWTSDYGYDFGRTYDFDGRDRGVRGERPDGARPRARAVGAGPQRARTTSASSASTTCPMRGTSCPR